MFGLQIKFKREIFAMIEEFWFNDKFISIFAIYIYIYIYISK